LASLYPATSQTYDERPASQIDLFRLETPYSGKRVM
jgi:hypothetical protein